MYTLEQIYEALGKIENGGTDGALKNLIATLTALQNAGGALSTLDTQMNGLKFRSTLLMRGATAVMLCSSTAKCHFNPRSSCEERLATRRACDILPVISIHAPHTRSDYVLRTAHMLCTAISIHAPHTRSDGSVDFVGAGASGISIHAPHARSDMFIVITSLDAQDFNPRSSCEERQYASASMSMYCVFQSTLLMRGATSGNTWPSSSA